MTKEKIEKLAKAMRSCANHELQRYIYELEEFFETNVVIPKGENPHPYADAIIESIIDSSKTLEVAEQFGDFSECFRIDLIDYTLRYRIKPQEPVYEWQWLEDGKVQNLGFYIQDELEDYPNKVYQKIEETKRIRK